MVCLCPETHTGDGIDCDPIIDHTDVDENTTDCAECHPSAECVSNATIGGDSELFLSIPLLMLHFSISLRFDEQESSVANESARLSSLSGPGCVCVNGTSGNGTWCDSDGLTIENLSYEQPVSFIRTKQIYILRSNFLFTITTTTVACAVVAPGFARNSVNPEECLSGILILIPVFLLRFSVRRAEMSSLRVRQSQLW